MPANTKPVTVRKLKTKLFFYLLPISHSSSQPYARCVPRSYLISAEHQIPYGKI